MSNNDNSNSTIPPSAGYMMVDRCHRYYNFANEMAYRFSQDDKNEYAVKFTMAEMNLISEAIRHYKYDVLGKNEDWDGIIRRRNNGANEKETKEQMTKRCNYTIGLTKRNCDIVRAKIEDVQLDIYEQSPGSKLIQVVAKGVGPCLVDSDHIEEDIAAIAAEEGDYGDLDSQTETCRSNNI